MLRFFLLCFFHHRIDLLVDCFAPLAILFLLMRFHHIFAVYAAVFDISVARATQRFSYFLHFSLLSFFIISCFSFLLLFICSYSVLIFHFLFMTFFAFLLCFIFFAAFISPSVHLIYAMRLHFTTRLPALSLHV